jgi:hypothetical protein
MASPFKPKAPASTLPGGGGLFVKNIRGEVINPAGYAEQQAINQYRKDHGFDAIEAGRLKAIALAQEQGLGTPRTTPTGLAAIDKGLNRLSGSSGTAAPTDTALSAAGGTLGKLNFSTVALAGLALLAAVWFFKRKG